jgi:uncharacterized protein DUF397
MDRMKWRKSSRSSANGGACIEVARLPDVVGIRDSKNPSAGYLAVSARAFGSLLDEIRMGQHTL